MFATNATDRVTLPANAPRAAAAVAAAGTAEAAAREDLAEAVRSVTSVTDLVILHATARMVLTDAIVVTVKVTSPKTATRAQTLRLATTVTSRATLLVRVRRLRMIRTTGVSHSPVTTATRLDIYRETARTTLRRVTYVTSLATSAVIVIRTVGSRTPSAEECTLPFGSGCLVFLSLGAATAACICIHWTSPLRRVTRPCLDQTYILLFFRVCIEFKPYIVVMYNQDDIAHKKVGVLPSTVETQNVLSEYYV